MPFTDNPFTNSSSTSSASLKTVGSRGSTCGANYGTTWSSAGQITMDDDCLVAFEDLKMRRGIRTVIFCLETMASTAPGDSIDACFRIRVHKVLSRSASHQDLLDELNAYQSAGQCRYILTDFDYINPTTNGENSKMIFFLWMPPKANIKEKMSYISNKNVILKALSGVYLELQNGDIKEFSYEKILKCVLSKQYTSTNYTI